MSIQRPPCGGWTATVGASGSGRWLGRRMRRVCRSTRQKRADVRAHLGLCSCAAVSIELEEVVCRTDERPFAADLLKPSQQKLAEAAAVFDLSEYPARRCSSASRRSRSLRRAQLPRHPLDLRRLSCERSAGRRPRAFTVFHFAGGDVAIDWRGGQIAQTRLGTVAAVRQQLSRGLPASAVIVRIMGASCCLSFVSCATASPTMS